MTQLANPKVAPCEYRQGSGKYEHTGECACDSSVGLTLEVKNGEERTSLVRATSRPSVSGIDTYECVAVLHKGTATIQARAQQGAQVNSTPARDDAWLYALSIHAIHLP